MTTDFHTPHGFAAPLTSAEVNSPLAELDAAIGRLHASVYAADYGVVADGVTDDYAAIAAAIADVPSAGGTLVLPAGTTVIGTGLDLSSKTGLVIRGQGGLGTAADIGTTLKYTGTGTYVVDMQNTFGVRLLDMQVAYSNAAFTGRVVDLRNVSGLDPSYCAVERCVVGGVGGAVGAAIGIDLDKATRVAVRDCLIARCQIGLQGKSVNGNYSNQVLIENVSFRENVVLNMKNPGQAWVVLANEFNPLANGKAGAIGHDAGVQAQGLTIMGCWMGDVTDAVNPSTQFDLYVVGALITGNYIGGTATTTGIITEAGSYGVIEKGNFYSTGITGAKTAMSPPLHSKWLAAHDAGLDGSSLVTLGAAPDIMNALSLADAATQGGYWTTWLPDDWDGHQLYVQPVWSPGSSDASSHAVRWSVDIAPLRGDGGQSPGAGGVTVAFTGAAAVYTATRVVFDTQTATGSVPNITATQPTRLIRVNLRRIGGDAADTYVGTVNLIGVVLGY